jgi:hypothetical protein
MRQKRGKFQDSELEKIKFLLLGSLAISLTTFAMIHFPILFENILGRGGGELVVNLSVLPLMVLSEMTNINIDTMLYYRGVHGIWYDLTISIFNRLLAAIVLSPLALLLHYEQK